MYGMIIPLIKDVKGPDLLFLFPFALNCVVGERTFGVLTKIDLMDKGTDAVDVS